MELNPSQPSLNPQQLPTHWKNAQLVQSADGKWLLQTPQNSMVLGSDAQWLRESAVAYTKGEQGLIAIRLLNAQGGLGKFLGWATLLDTLALAETKAPKATDVLDLKQVSQSSAYTSDGKIPSDIPLLTDTEKKEVSLQMGRVISTSPMEGTQKNNLWQRVEIEAIGGKLLGYSRETIPTGVWREFSQDSLGQIIFSPNRDSIGAIDVSAQNPKDIINKIVEQFLKPLDNPAIKNHLVEQFAQFFKTLDLEKALVQNGVAGLRDAVANYLREAGFANFTWQSAAPTLEEVLDNVLPQISKSILNSGERSQNQNSLNSTTNFPNTNIKSELFSAPQVLALLTAALGSADLLQFLPKDIPEASIKHLSNYQHIKQSQLPSLLLASASALNQGKLPMILSAQMPLAEWIASSSIHTQSTHTRELAHFLAEAITQQWGHSVSFTESEGSTVYYNAGGWQGVKWKWDGLTGDKDSTHKDGKSKGLKLRLGLTAILLGAVEVGLVIEEDGFSLDLGNDGVDLHSLLNSQMPTWALYIESQGYPLKNWFYHKIILAQVSKHVWTPKLDAGGLDLRA